MLRDAGKFWLPVLFWMTLIFMASTDLGSTRQTSRFIGPFLRFIWPDISAETIHGVQVVVRKTGHLTGYAILAGLIWQARQRGFLAGGWSWKSARLAVAVAAIYAVSDEWHQSMVPTRQGSGWDVLIDTIGACAGLGALWMIGRFRRKW